MHLDFSGVFDSVPHRRLLDKLEAYIISETPYINLSLANTQYLEQTSSHIVDARNINSFIRPDWTSTGLSMSMTKIQYTKSLVLWVYYLNGPNYKQAVIPSQSRRG